MHNFTQIDMNTGIGFDGKYFTVFHETVSLADEHFLDEQQFGSILRCATYLLSIGHGQSMPAIKVRLLENGFMSDELIESELGNFK